MPDQPQPDGPQFGIHTDWFTSMWPHVLPQQAFPLAMLFSSASMSRLEGTLDDLVATLYGDRQSLFLRELGDGLDSPVLWHDPDEDLTDEEIAEAKERGETTLRNAGIEPPSTVRSLADLMVRLGIVTHDDNRWDMPEHLPRPEETLRLPAELEARIRDFRRREALTVAEQAILRHLIDDLNRPDETTTTLERLAQVTDLEPDELRGGLSLLIEDEDIRLYRNDTEIQPTKQALPAHARFRIVPDWEHYAEHRIHIQRADGQSEPEQAEA